LKCKEIEAAVNEDDISFVLNDSRWNLDSKSSKEKECKIIKNNQKIIENNWND
jgi:hypothetical protein